MFIVPMNGLTPTLFQTESSSETSRESGVALPFEDLLKSAVDNVKRTQAVAARDAVDLALGNVDDLHNIIINSEKAETSLQLLVQIRNKALDAYSEIMRMNI